jgi:hypothetical protein
VFTDSVGVELACPCMSTLPSSTFKHWYDGEYVELSLQEVEILEKEHSKVCTYDSQRVNG